jgi:uncharacterized protein YndB with AHSA1/START domain
MTAIAASIDISRRPEDVFSYATDFSHFPHWQGSVVSARRKGDAPLAVGSQAVVTQEITELTPPRTWEARCRRHPGDHDCQRHDRATRRR